MKTIKKTANATKIKFCGITNKEDIVAAEQLEVDFLGFIFITASPRHIKLSEAIKLRKNIKKAKLVGVFSDMPAEDIQNHISLLKLDYIQLHGKPDLELCKKFSFSVIQAFKRLPSIKILKKFLEVCPYLLIDKEDGKDQADFIAIAALPQNIRDRIFLAGGITTSNVRQLVQTIHPFAVDCARGVESSPGEKDHSLMVTFVSEVRN